MSFNKHILFYVKNNGECYMTDGKSKPADINFKLSINTLSALESFNLKNAYKLSGTLNKKYLIKVVCGRAHVIFLTHAGMVFSFGEGGKGQLGHVNTNDLTEPSMITSLLNYRINDVSVGADHNIAVGVLRELTKKAVSSNSITNNPSDLLVKGKEQNLIFVWGDNSKGQLGLGVDPSFVNSPKILELTGCGSSDNANNNSTNNAQVISVKKIQTGLEHSLILFENGNLFGMGSNENKQICENKSNAEMKDNQGNNNINNNYIYTPLRIKQGLTGKNITKGEKMKFKNIKCSANSSLLITENCFLFLNGKINKEGEGTEFKNKIFKVKGELAERLKNSEINYIFTDEHLYIFHNPNKEQYTKLIEAVSEEASPEAKISLKINSASINNRNSRIGGGNGEHYRLSLAEDTSNNFFSTPNEEGLFQEYDISKDFFSDNASTNELFENNMSFEQSIEELRSYISLVGISYIGDSGHSPMTFRPKNLPKKTPEEEDYHRKLVEENRRRYIKFLKDKQEEERKQKEKLDKKKLQLKKLQDVWEEEILPNWFKRKNDKNYLRKFFYEGLPTNIRGRVWLLCLGNNFSITPEYYEIEVKKAVAILLQLQSGEETERNNKEKDMQAVEDSLNSNLNKYNIHVIDKEKSIKYIELDIERTFHYLGIFKNNSPLSEDLREILRAFVASRPDIGYVQGLSYIAGMLLLHMDKYQAFVALMNITLSHNIIPFYRFDEHQIRKRIQIFKQIFYHNLPELCDHFESLDILPEIYLIEWTMTLFAKSLNIDISARIWDIYMIEGIKAIYQAAIGKATLF